MADYIYLRYKGRLFINVMLSNDVIGQNSEYHSFLVRSTSIAAITHKNITQNLWRKDAETSDFEGALLFTVIGFGLWVWAFVDFLQPFHEGSDSINRIGELRWGKCGVRSAYHLSHRTRRGALLGSFSAVLTSQISDI